MGELVTTSSSDVTSAEARERLVQLAAAAAEYVEEVPNTKRAYDSGWRAWQAYCEAVRIPVETVGYGSLVGFVAWHERHQFAPATIDNRIAAVIVRQREAGREIPAAETREARKALGRYVRKLAEEGRKLGRGQAPALTIPKLRQVLAKLPDTAAGKRDRLILLLGFGIAARRSELSSLDVGDVVEHEEGLTVHIRYGKTGGRKVAVLRGAPPDKRPDASGKPKVDTCPVRAYRAWKAVLGEQPDDAPLLRPINKAGRIVWTRKNKRGETVHARLSGESISRAINEAGEAARVSDLSGHSLRSGLATEARRAGHDPRTIGVQGGWSENSGELFRYMQIVDQWADNATKGLGL